MDRVEAAEIMDAVESNRPWGERIQAWLGHGEKENVRAVRMLCSSCGRRYVDAQECVHCVAVGGKDYNFIDHKQYLGSEDGTAAGAAHYQIGDKQPIEIMQDVMTTEEFFGYLRGNVIKYSLRLGHKDSKAKDAQKAAQYSKWMAQALTGKKINPREEQP